MIVVILWSSQVVAWAKELPSKAAAHQFPLVKYRLVVLTGLSERN
jgi:hypothetical protein